WIRDRRAGFPRPLYLMTPALLSWPVSAAAGGAPLQVLLQLPLLRRSDGHDAERVRRVVETEVAANVGLVKAAGVRPDWGHRTGSGQPLPQRHLRVAWLQWGPVRRKGRFCRAITSFRGFDPQRSWPTSSSCRDLSRAV